MIYVGFLRYISTPERIRKIISTICRILFRNKKRAHLRNLIEAKAASSAEASPSINEFCSKMLEFMDLKSEIDTLLNEK